MTDPEKPDPAELFLGLEKTNPASDSDTMKEEIAWAKRLAPLDDGTDDSLPTHIWSGLEARLNRQDALPGFTTVTANEGRWESLCPGITRKIVHLDTERDTLCYFLRLDEGAILPSHVHTGEEHCVVLQGELRMGDIAFGEGSYQLARTDTHHPPVTALTPALVYIQGAV